jgi:hypothetical protein
MTARFVKKNNTAPEWTVCNLDPPLNVARRWGTECLLVVWGQHALLLQSLDPLFSSQKCTWNGVEGKAHNRTILWSGGFQALGR